MESLDLFGDKTFIEVVVAGVELEVIFVGVDAALVDFELDVIVLLVVLVALELAVPLSVGKPVTLRRSGGPAVEP